MPKRVLVVDDEVASRMGLQALLAGRGYRVETAATGAEALEKARSFRPAVVIADLVMRGWTAWTSSAVCRRRSPSR